MKKILAILLAMIMVLSLGMTAWASSEVGGEGGEGGEGGTTTATTGSITVKNATKGYEYKAYKVFDATYSGDKVSYKTPAANASLLDDTLFGWSTAADTDGNITVWALDDADEDDILDWVKTNYAAFGGTAIDGVFDETNSTVTFSNLDFGYYYITSGLGAAVTIDSAAPTAEVYDKNETTPVDPAKEIVSVDGQDASGITADAHVGSVIGFKVTAKTNNWIDKDTIRTEWEMTDTPTNMTIDPDSIIVKFNDTPLTKGTDYTATIDDSGKLTINVPMTDADGNSVFAANLGDTAGLIPIEITYSATIDAAAADAPATNEVGDTTVTITTYEFKLNKVDGEENELLGAEFELWANDAALKFDKNEDGSYTYNANGSTTTISLLEVASAVIKGLDKNWTYTLKEITVPAGYNQAEDKEIAGSTLTPAAEGATPVDVDVVNEQGVELPSTGGIGTTIFYVVGGLLAVGAGVVLVTKKRMGKEEL